MSDPQAKAEAIDEEVRHDDEVPEDDSVVPDDDYVPEDETRAPEVAAMHVIEDELPES